MLDKGHDEQEWSAGEVADHLSNGWRVPPAEDLSAFAVERLRTMADRILEYLGAQS